MYTRRHTNTHFLALVFLGSAFVVMGIAQSVAQAELEATQEKADAPKDAGITCRVQPGRATVYLGDQLILEYILPSEGPKCYVKTFCTPQGINVLRDSPPDHVHHHGLMFALGVDETDYWAEGPGCGLQIPVGEVEINTKTQAAFFCGSLRHMIEWKNERRQPQLIERRQITVVHFKRPDFPRLLIWHSRLNVAGAASQRVLWGRPYFGLGCRFVASMDGTGQFRNSEGGVGVAGTNGKAAKWCAYTAAAETHLATLLIGDHPRNPRHPAVWFTMDQPFSYVSATLNLAEEKYVLKAGETVELQYITALWDGKPAVKNVQEMTDFFEKIIETLPHYHRVEEN